jgi:tetratricopeptide (TPR) repeat protein
MISKRRKLRLIVIFLLVCGAGFLWRPVWEECQRNLLALDIMHSMLNNNGNSQQVSIRTARDFPEESRENWFLGLLAAKLNDQNMQEIYWAKYLDSSLPEALWLVHAGARGNARLALQATQVYPNDAESWFWLAETLYQTNQNPQAIPAYQRSLQLDPQNGFAWCRLGGLLEYENPIQSRAAYLQCCYHGDFGSNGCFNAGQISEELGEIDAAIKYYRLSQWVESNRRADALERSLRPLP